MSASTALMLIMFLSIKHFIVDFPLQKPYQWQNKGTYGHPGGIVHAGLHALGTLVVFAFFTSLPMAIAAAVIDAVIHYHVDWAKMNLNKRLGYGPLTHEGFWTLLGLDQLLHVLTYIALTWLVI